MPFVHGHPREDLILHHTTTHNMNIQRTLAMFAIPMLLVACSSENGGAGEETAPANSEIQCAVVAQRKQVIHFTRQILGYINRTVCC